MKKYRKEKMEEMIKRELSKIIFKDLRDPRIIGLININSVEMSGDLKIAKIYISIFGEIDKIKAKESFTILNSASNFLKYKLSHNLNLKYTPELKLIYDESVERGVRVIEKLDRLKKEREKYV